MAKRTIINIPVPPPKRRGRPPGSRNKLPPRDHNQVGGGMDTTRLRNIIHRIERLQEEKQAIQGDVSDLFSEAKGGGFSPEAIRVVLKLRAKPADEVTELEATVDLYRRAMEDSEPEAEAEIEEQPEVEPESAEEEL